MAERSAAFTAFQVPSFRRYQAARFTITLVTQMAGTAVGLQVYDATHRPLALGYVGLAQFITAFLLVLPSGVVADRFDRRRVVATCHLLLAAGWAILAAATRHGVHDVAAVYAVLVMMGVARSFSGPAASALLPNLVPPSVLGNAVSWSSTVWQLATIAGPPLGGVVYAIGGASAVYACALAGALVSATLVQGVGIVGSARGGSRRVGSASELLAGVRYVWTNRLVLGLISLDLFAVLLGGAVALMPVYARAILHADAVTLGWLRGAPAIGATMTALWLAWRPLRHRAGPWMLGCVAIFGAATIVFGLSRNLYLSLAALVVVGASDMVSVVIRSHAVQVATPDAMRGRVSAVNLVFVGASNELGEFESGVTADLFGPVRAVVGGGIGTLLVVAAWTGLFPSLRDLDRLDRDGEAKAS